jgi:hypothetical protein
MHQLPLNLLLSLTYEQAVQGLTLVPYLSLERWELKVIGTSFACSRLSSDSGLTAAISGGRTEGLSQTRFHSFFAGIPGSREETRKAITNPS